MKTSTINQAFKKVYTYLLLVAIVGFGLISYNFANNLIENNIKNTVFKHSVKSKQQVDQLLGFILIGSHNAVKYYLEEVRLEEGLQSTYILDINPCGLNNYCRNHSLQIVTPIEEVNKFLVKEVKLKSLIISDVFNYISSSIALFVLCLILVWFLLSKLIKSKFVNIISDFKSMLSGENVEPKSSLREVRELLDQNEKMIKKAEKVKIAQQVAHDIQSPLEILKSLQEDLDVKDNKFEEKVLNDAIERIIAISDDLLTNKRHIETLNPTCTLSEILHEKKCQFGDITFNIDYKLNDNANIEFNSSYLKRIISNIINNSIEANAKSITLNACEKKGEVHLSISDDGDGIEDKVLPQIFEDAYTTKEAGHGIGLSFAKTLIEEFGGNISAIKNGKGLSIEIVLPIVELSSNDTEIILIDDDRFTQLNWKKAASDKGIKLSIYNTVNSFIIDSSKFQNNTPVYVDSNLGDGLKGEVLSKQIFDLGFKNIFLATGENISDIQVPFWIKKVQGKRFYVQ